MVSTSCNGSNLFSQSVIRRIKPAGIIVDKISNNSYIDFIGRGLSEDVGFRKVFDQHRINNKGIIVMIQEKFEKSEMIQSCGFHKERWIFKPTSLQNKIMEPCFRYRELTRFFKFGLSVHDVERRFVFGNINLDYVIYSKISRVKNKGVPFLISFLTQALQLNQPIRTQEKLGRLLSKLSSLNKMKPYAPKFNTLCI